MSDQPEALRLADELAFAARHYDSFDKRLSSGASNELRRQHSEIVELKAERDALLAATQRQPLILDQISMIFNRVYPAVPLSQNIINLVQEVEKHHGIGGDK